MTAFHIKPSLSKYTESIHVQRVSFLLKRITEIYHTTGVGDRFLELQSNKNLFYPTITQFLNYFFGII